MQYFANLGYNNYCIVPIYPSSLLSLLSLLFQGTPPLGQLVPQPLHLIFVWKRARFDFLTIPPPKAKLWFLFRKIAKLCLLFCIPKITINYFLSPSRTMHCYNPPGHRVRRYSLLNEMKISLINVLDFEEIDIFLMNILDLKKY